MAIGPLFLSGLRPEEVGSEIINLDRFAAVPRDQALPHRRIDLLGNGAHAAVAESVVDDVVRRPQRRQPTRSSAAHVGLCIIGRCSFGCEPSLPHSSEVVISAHCLPIALEDEKDRKKEKKTAKIFFLFS